uniref:Uncharacterized protein n=1 Tax=Cucumis melo TaxID=3656 RepID=A0A9I9EAL4_CUCME
MTFLCSLPLGFIIFVPVLYGTFLLAFARFVAFHEIIDHMEQSENVRVESSGDGFSCMFGLLWSLDGNLHSLSVLKGSVYYYSYKKVKQIFSMKFRICHVRDIRNDLLSLLVVLAIKMAHTLMM